MFDDTEAEEEAIEVDVGGVANEEKLLQCGLCIDRSFGSTMYRGFLTSARQLHSGGESKDYWTIHYEDGDYEEMEEGELLGHTRRMAGKGSKAKAIDIKLEPDLPQNSIAFKLLPKLHALSLSRLHGLLVGMDEGRLSIVRMKDLSAFGFLDVLYEYYRVHRPDILLTMITALSRRLLLFRLASLCEDNCALFEDLSATLESGTRGE